MKNKQKKNNYKLENWTIVNLIEIVLELQRTLVLFNFTKCKDLEIIERKYRDFPLSHTQKRKVEQLK